MFFDPMYLLFAMPALLLGLWAQFRVKSAYAKFSRVRTAVGMTGAEVARRMLDMSGLYNVQVEQVQGFLSDHYDPRTRVLRLSPEVYQGNSVASAGIAAHEAGHALQHQDAYLPMQIRSAIVPTVQFGSWLGPVLFIIGLVLNWTNLAWAGVILFGVTALFAVITLPVELNASNRAKAWLANSSVLYPQELPGINAVLNAAALTYVAAAAQSISTLLYYVFLLGGRSRD